MKPGKECERLHQQCSHCPMAPGTWEQAEEGLPGPGPSLQRTPRNIQRCRWVWDLKKPPTVDCTLGSLQTTLLPEAKGQAVPSYVAWDHQNQYRCLSPKGGPVYFFKSSPLFLLPIVPCFLLCFWKTNVLSQQDKEYSVIIPNVSKYLLEIRHSGAKQDVTRRDLLKTCISFWSEIQLSILHPLLPCPLKPLIRDKGRI